MSAASPNNEELWNSILNEENERLGDDQIPELNSADVSSNNLFQQDDDTELEHWFDSLNNEEDPKPVEEQIDEPGPVGPPDVSGEAGPTGETGSTIPTGANDSPIQPGTVGPTGNPKPTGATVNSTPTGATGATRQSPLGSGRPPQAQGRPNAPQQQGQAQNSQAQGQNGPTGPVNGAGQQRFTEIPLS